MLTKKYGHVRTLQLAKRNEILQNISTCPQKIKANYLHQKKKSNILNWSTFQENPNAQPQIK